MKAPFAITLLFAALSAQADGSILEKEYKGFTVWLDCEKHGAVAFKYEVGKDNGQIERNSHSFSIDDSVPASCQPTSTKSFRNEDVDVERTGKYDRGHFVPANHMDNDKVSYTDTFNMTNILPQQMKFNRKGGAWGYSELVTECFRDISPLTVWGGVIWGDDKSDDFFVKTHNVETPDYWWKVIKRHDSGDFIAWLFPNSKETIKKDADKYIVSLNELLPKLQHVPEIDISPEHYDYKPNPSSWVTTGSVQLKCEGISTPNS